MGKRGEERCFRVRWVPGLRTRQQDKSASGVAALDPLSPEREKRARMVGIGRYKRGPGRLRFRARARPLRQFRSTDEFVDRTHAHRFPLIEIHAMHNCGKGSALGRGGCWGMDCS